VRGIPKEEEKMERFTLQASRRTLTGKKVSQLREKGLTPAILYGRSIKEPIPVSIDRIELSKALRKSTYSSLITISVDGVDHPTLVRDFEFDKIQGHLTHVDFLVVSLTEKVRAEVSVIMEGKAPVVANSGGLLVTNLERVEVESLPQDLPQHFVIDVSGLVDFGDGIHVRDLNVPANVTVLTDADELIVVASAPVSEAEEGPAAAAAAATPAAGAAPAAAAPAAGEAAAGGDKK
jgi:large subunit ribosomal protein L25